MKTPEQLMKELMEIIEHERKIIHDTYRSTIDGLRKTIKELECSCGLYRLNYEQQTKRIQQIVAALGVQPVDPNDINPEKDEEIDALNTRLEAVKKDQDTLMGALRAIIELKPLPTPPQPYPTPSGAPPEAP